MDFGDRPPSAMRATTVFKTPLLTSDNGKSPTLGLSQFVRQHFHVSTVEHATGLRFRVWTRCSHHFACSRNVTPTTRVATLRKYSSLSAPLAEMISRARRSRSDWDRRPGPETGHILSLLCTLAS